MGHRFDPWSRRIPHAAEQQTLCAATIEPVYPRAYGHNKTSQHDEKLMHHNKV